MEKLCACSEMSLLCKAEMAVSFKCPKHGAVTIDKRTPTMQWWQWWPYWHTTPYTQPYVPPLTGGQTTQAVPWPGGPQIFAGPENPVIIIGPPSSCIDCQRAVEIKEH